MKADLPITAADIKAKLIGKDEANLTLMDAVNAHNKYIQKEIGIEISRATYSKYETLRLKLGEFLPKQYHRKDMLLKELNGGFVVNFELHLKTEGVGHNTAVKYSVSQEDY